MSSALTRTAGSLIVTALLSATPSLAAPSSVAPENASEASVDMNQLLDALAERAAEYKRFALGFTCEESVVRTSYKAESGSFRSRDREVYDYLFTVDEETGRLNEVREILEENGRPVRRNVRDLGLGIPPAYAWSQMFARENRGRFSFRYAGRLITGYRLLIQIDFVGSAARPGKDDIAGWSGRASIDSETLNLHSIEAEPSGQAARLEAERLKYQRAFAIMGVPLATRPKSRTLSVTFGFMHEGLTYPATATFTKSVYVSTAEQGLEQSLILRYRSYRFFRVGTQVDEPRDAPVSDSPAGEDEPSADPQPAADPNLAGF